MDFLSTDGWQPNGERRGRNSGTKGSVNDRRCSAPGCGREGELKQTTSAWPVRVWCASCHNEIEPRLPPSVRMRATKEETARFEQARRDSTALASAAASAQRDARVQANREENPRPTRSQTKARFDQLMRNCARRPEPRRLFYNPLGRAMDMLICACNCAIGLVAGRFPPVVYMFFLSLFGCTCAKKGDIVAIPKDYVIYAIAVYTLLHARYKVDQWAFVNYRAMEQALDHQELPSYGRAGRGFDEKYDEVERSDSIRVSLLAPTNKKTLLPMSRYRKDEDFLGEITSETVGHSSRVVVEIPCICQGVETVVAFKCKRRQFVMAYLSFACVAGALGTCLWSAAHVLDFTALQEGVAAATIDNIIESKYKGQHGVDLVGKFMKLYIPIFEMLQAFLIEAFDGRLPTEEELAVVIDRQRGKVRLGECHRGDNAVKGSAASRAADEIAGQIGALAKGLREDLSQSRVKEAFRKDKPGLSGKAWRFAYGARDYAYAAVAAVKRGRRSDDADDDCGPSKRLRAGEGMPSAAENAAAFDNSCKELEPQGSTDPRHGVRRHLLADIANHSRRNAVHQLDFSNL